MEVINMYRMIEEDRPVLRDAFEAFRDLQQTRHWHYQFHEHHDRQGQGQYVAMILMKTSLKGSVEQLGMANQAKMHENFEGFIAWSLSKDQQNGVWKQAAQNVLCFMVEIGKMMMVLPWEEFEINDEWDLKRLQENVVTIMDEREGVRMT